MVGYGDSDFMLYLRLIWRQVKLAAGHLATIGMIVWSYAKSHKIIASAVLVVIVALFIGLGYLIGNGEGAEPITNTRAVTLIRVGDSSGAESLSLIGTVRATREALVAPDTSGQVSALYRNLGDYVGAGTTIAELKNDTQRAQVSQARAALQKAESAVQAGGIGVGSAESSYAAAQEAARASIQAAYATVDDVVRRKADQTFSNPTSSQPKLKLASVSSQVVLDTELGRIAVQPILARQAAQTVVNVSVDGLFTELERLATEVQTVRAFLQNLVTALNGAIPNTEITEAEIALYRSDAALALSSVNALSSTLSGTAENLRAKRAAVDIAKTNLSTGATGQSADIAAAEANLAIALATLEKTLIRAPISGTINRLDLEVGSFVNASQPVIYITNPGGLEAVAFVSGTDLKDVSVGSKATVAGVVVGTVVRVAGALDPVTKKAEVRISIPPSAPLVSGQSATLAIERRTQAVGETAELSIPLSALKITPEGPLVFTVSDEGALIGNPVTLGALRGNSVVILSGVTGDTEIVEDARGLKVGQEVLVSL